MACVLAEIWDIEVRPVSLTGMYDADAESFSLVLTAYYVPLEGAQVAFSVMGTGETFCEAFDVLIGAANDFEPA